MTILSRERILQTKVTCKTSRICPRQRQWAKLSLVQESTVPGPSLLSKLIRKHREVVLLRSARGYCQVFGYYKTEVIQIL